jgi:hypothetical protein
MKLLLSPTLAARRSSGLAIEGDRMKTKLGEAAKNHCAGYNIDAKDGWVFISTLQGRNSISIQDTSAQNRETNYRRSDYDRRRIGQVLNLARALSTILRIASCRVGLGTACASRQASSASSVSRTNRTFTASLSTRGRPILFLELRTLDTPIL